MRGPWSTLVAAAWSSLLAQACAGGETTSAPRPEVEEAAPVARGPAAEVGGDVVSTVDGEPISLAEVEEVARSSGVTPRQALRRLQDERVLAHLAEQSPAARDPAVLSALRRAAVRALLASDVEATNAPESITEGEIEAARAPIARALSSPETRRGSHVLVPLDEDAPAERLDAALRLARRIRDELRAEAAPSTALDRYVGPQGAFEVQVEHLEVSRREAFVPAFSDALFGATEVGLIEEPVRTSFGVHVIVLEEIVPPWEVPREEWEPVMRRQALAQRRARALEELAEQLAARTPVTVDPRAAALVETAPLEREPGPRHGEER